MLETNLNNQTISQELKQTVPQIVFKTRVRDANLEGDNPFKWQDITSQEIFENKKVIIFSLPGAFTPTCSNSHLPEYDKMYQEFKNLGIDEVYCISVNDAFVMYQWGLKLDAKNVKLLPDGNGEFTKAMGMLVKKENLGFGERSWRYSMYVDNSNIEQIFAEPNKCDNHDQDPFEVSDAQTMLNYLSKTL